MKTVRKWIPLSFFLVYKDIIALILSGLNTKNEWEDTISSNNEEWKKKTEVIKDEIK